MSLAYWPGSSTEMHLKDIADRIDGEAAKEFSGVIVGSVKILYRYGTLYNQVTKGNRYPRWAWKIPFGHKKDWPRVDFVLLHGPGRAGVRESFFLFSKRDAARNYAMWPDRLNMGADPVKIFGNTERLRDRQMTLSEVKQIIRNKNAWIVRRKAMH